MHTQPVCLQTVGVKVPCVAFQGRHSHQLTVNIQNENNVTFLNLD